MKLKIVLIVIFFSALFTVNAQENKSKFGVGIHTDFFNIPLNNELFSYHTDGVHCIYSIKKINLKIAFESSMLIDMDNNRYEKGLGGLFEIGYFIYKDPTKNFSTELFLSYGNFFINSNTFNNQYAKFGVNSVMFKSFYIGTGLKYFHLEKKDFSDLPENNFNWFWHIGMQLYLGKKKKN